MDMFQSIEVVDQPIAFVNQGLIFSALSFTTIAPGMLDLPFRAGEMGENSAGVIAAVLDKHFGDLVELNGRLIARAGVFENGVRSLKGNGVVE